ncbi:MAG TPA: hypothetical protein VHV51_19735 [Polyangiaceae bacterium]|jgi:hypothetical protein|nr:hypothetical protein [Polyangiaceae bacterium]
MPVVKRRFWIGSSALLALGVAAPRAFAAPEAMKPAAPAASAAAPATPSAAPPGSASAAAPVAPNSAAASSTPSATPAAASTAPASATPTPNAANGTSAAAADSTTGPTAAAASADEAGNSASANDSFTASNEETSDTDSQHRLDLYGFADFTYQRLLLPSSNVWVRTYPSVNSFAVGNFNLYMSSNLGDSWRALAEVRFLYLPNGATTVDPSTGAAIRTDTTVLDYAGFEEPIRWGGISIQRIYIEHEFSGLFKLQAGQFLTPYGIWNVDHGSPTIIGIKKPFVVSDELFPEAQVGLHLYGSYFFDPVEVGYDLTLSNGRGPVEYQDFNDDKAVGGRVYGKTDAVGTLTVGGSFYRGGYYDRSAQYTTTTLPDGSLGVDQTYTTISRYQELSLAADVKWEYDAWLAQGEIIENETHFKPGDRPRQSVIRPPNGLQADYRRWGAYGLVGYRLPFVPLMPYVLVQHSISPDQPNTPPATAYEVGVNLRPTGAVVVKLEYSDWHFSAPGAAGFGAYPLRILASQVAWAF